MAQLVRDDSSHFPFGLGRLDHSSVHVHRPARQREGVDLFHVDDLERVSEFRVTKLRRDRIDKTLPDVRHVRRDRVVSQQRQLLLDLSGRVPAKLHIVAGVVFVFRRRDLRLSAYDAHGKNHGRDDHL